MAITINTNMSSLISQKSLNAATNKMSTAMQRLSTGLRINSSKDDAAGSAVTTRLDYKISSLAVAEDNAQMGSSLLETAEGTLDVVQSNLARIRDLTEQAANGTYGSDAMTAIKAEISGRLDEITRISNTTDFNGKKLLDGSMDSGINLQVGIDADANSVIKLDGSLFKDADATALLGNYELKLEDGEAYTSTNNDFADKIKIGNNFFDLDGKKLTLSANQDTLATKWAALTGSEAPTAVDGDTYTIKANDSDAVKNLDVIFTNDVTAQAFLNNIDKALANVTDRKTQIGAAQQRVNSAMEVTKVMSNNLTSAKSLIEDADIAEESSNYIKNQILQQTASSLLATANQNPSIALSLI